ncbi:malonate decarboxylase holo-[acyl-carrier-protein] synthase [Paraburkholderia bryophila]|uniref:malonate decarboxylase holo-[acyl-carrier-protein] synthase n=1 Tax=Burkholderiaceae TaxID=119060 RepID=UPI0005558EFB|nr:malonate decarboxylase holo-[acyl-carrier-protein] synthase [Burkholderia sp. 9120]
MLDFKLPIERHRLVWVDPARWSEVIAKEPALLDEPLVAGWADAGRPVISRRAVCSDEATMAPLGLPLPPAWGKGRVSLRVPLDALVDDAPAPLLKAAACTAPAAWLGAIGALLEIDSKVRCFGSLAWQYLTGLPYVTATSDLDLLWGVGDASRATALTRRIERVAKSAPMRIDGELVSPSGRAVQWMEWRSDAGMLLAKHTDGVRLVERDEVYR